MTTNYQIRLFRQFVVLTIAVLNQKQ